MMMISLVSSLQARRHDTGSTCSVCKAKAEDQLVRGGAHLHPVMAGMGTRGGLSLQHEQHRVEVQQRHHTETTGWQC